MVSHSAMALHPLAVLESLTLRLGEYPVNLMARRAWPLDSPDVANRRPSSSGSSWSDPRSFPDSLTCRDSVFRIE